MFCTKLPWKELMWSDTLWSMSSGCWWISFLGYWILDFFAQHDTACFYSRYFTSFSCVLFQLLIDGLLSFFLNDVNLIIFCIHDNNRVIHKDVALDGSFNRFCNSCNGIFFFRLIVNSPLPSIGS